MHRGPYLIPPHAGPDEFPDPGRSLREPNGLLAVGGDLRPARLLAAYGRGIFPWFEEGQPVLWWCPDPRAVLFPDQIHVSRSLRRTLRRGALRLSWDRAFSRVVHACAAPRSRGAGTWITPDMLAAYTRLHRLGHAHSLECWQGEDLVGGLYGVAIGAVFFGESMFSRVTDASKVALVALAAAGFELIDCQVPNPHLTRMGAVEIPRREFLALIERGCALPSPLGAAPGGLA
jgi:leucyl/phenylalanyl-tRNA--protein transferase